MIDEEKIDQQAIDELLATATKELLDLTPELQINNNESQKSPTNSEADLLSSKQNWQSPIIIAKTLKTSSPTKKIATIIILFLLFTVGGAALGFKLTQQTVEAKSPLDKLLQMGITFEEKNLVTYAGRGDNEIIADFLEAGMPVNSIRTTDGWTPLIAACFYKKTDIVEQLLAQQATVNIRDKYGKTPLMYAAAMGAEDIVGLLLAAGADPNIQDINGRTALMEAYSKNQAKIAEILKAAGADPNLRMIAKTEEQTTLPIVKKYQPAPILPSQIPESNRLTVGKAGLIKIGMSIADLQKNYADIVIREQFIDGNKKSIAIIYLNNKKTPSLKVELSSGKVQLISMINTYDEQFSTDKNITVNSTVGEIRDQYSISDIKVINNSLFLVVKSMKMLFELDTKSGNISTDWLESGNPQSIPPNTKIIRIINY